MYSRPAAHPTATHIQDLFTRHRYSEAESVLDDALESDPTDPDLNAAAVLLHLWSQRETEILPFLELAALSTLFPTALQLATDAFHCRSLTAKKIGAADPVGVGILSELLELGLKPTESCGIGISAILITRDEAENLPRCLKSLHGVVDEIVVIDTGSTDSTIEIAKEFGAEVRTFDWVQDFSAARNASIELATQPWLFWIDADEELAVESVSMIREAVMRPQFGGFQILIQNLLSVETEQNYYTHAPIRLFRNLPEIRFTGKIHEQIVGGINATGLRTAMLEGVTIKHYGYQPEVIESRKKIGRTLELLTQEIEREPHFSFHWFNLANTFLVAKQFSEAELAAKKAIELLEPEASYKAACWDVLSSALIQQDQFDEALVALQEAKQNGHWNPVLQYQEAEALRRLSRTEEAGKSNDVLLKMSWPSGLTGDFSVMSYKRWLQAARIALTQHRFDDALRYCGEATVAVPGLVQARGLAGYAFAGLGKYEKAIELARSCLDHPEERDSAQALLAQIEQAQSGQGIAPIWERWRAAAEQNDEDAISGLPSESLTTDQFCALASTFESHGNLGTALKLYEDCIRAYPDEANPFFCLGDTLYRHGHFMEAASSYSHGLQRQPDHADAWFVLGNALAQMEQDQAAIHAYDQCLCINPNHQAAQQNRQTILDCAA